MQASNRATSRRHVIQRVILTLLLFAVTAPTWTLGGSFVDDWLPLTASHSIYQKFQNDGFMPGMEFLLQNSLSKAGRTVPLLRPYQFVRYLMYGGNVVADRIHNTLVCLILLQLVYSLTRRLTHHPTAPLLAGLFVLFTPATSTVLFRIQTQEQLIAPLLVGYLLTIHSSFRALETPGPHAWRRTAAFVALGCILLLAALGFKETSVSVFPSVGVLTLLYMIHGNPRARKLSAAMLACAVVCGLLFVWRHSLTPKISGAYASAYDVHDITRLTWAALLWRDKLRIAYGGLAYFAVAAVVVRVAIARVKRTWPNSMSWRIALLVYAAATIALLLPWEKDEGRLMLHGLCGFAIVMAIETCELWSMLRKRQGTPVSAHTIGIASLALLACVFLWLAPPLELPINRVFLVVTIPAIVVVTLLIAATIVLLVRTVQRGGSMPAVVRWGGRAFIAANLGYSAIFALPGMWNANWYDVIWENPHNNALCRYLAAVVPYHGRIFADRAPVEWTGHLTWAGTIQQALRWHDRPDIAVYPMRDSGDATSSDLFLTFGRGHVYDDPVIVPAGTGFRAVKHASFNVPYFSIEPLRPRNLALNALNIWLPSSLQFTKFVTHEDRSWTVYLPAIPADVRGREPGAPPETEDIGWTELHWAARSGDVQKVKRILKKHADPTAPTLWGDTPLHMAANASVIQVLLEAGADPNAATLWGDTPLHRAAYHGDSPSCELLLENGANPNRQGASGETPLHAAAAARTHDIADVLLAHGAKVDAADSFGRTPLHYAAHVTRGRTIADPSAVMSVLAQHGAKIPISDDRGRHPLHDASRNTDMRSVKWLVEHGADVTHKDSEGATALHALIRSGTGSPKDSLVRYLIAHGADPNARDQEKKTPLHYAAIEGPPVVVSVLCELGADIDAQDSNGCTPLFFAAVGGNVGMVSALLAFDPEIEIANTDGVTPWMAAVICNHFAVERQLADMGANFDIRMMNGRTPVHFAAANGGTRILDSLLARGLELTTRDNDAKTPLVLAAETAQIGAVYRLIHAGAPQDGQWPEVLGAASACALDNEIDSFHHVQHLQIRSAALQLLLAHAPASDEVNAAVDSSVYNAARSGDAALLAPLLDRGADVRQTDDRGRTPLDLAIASKNAQAVALLLRHGAPLEGADPKASPLLAAASVSSADELIPLLLEHGADPAVSAANGTTALHAAAARGHAIACSALLSAGANVDGRNDNGRTALHYAAETGNMVTLKSLLAAGADPVAVDNAGNTALLRALASGHADHATLLEEAGAKIGDDEHIMFVAAAEAARLGAAESVAFILRHGFDPNRKDGTGRPWIVSTIIGKDPECLSAAIEYGADATVADNRGFTPLHWAVREGFAAAIAILLEAGADVNATAECNPQGRGMAPIHLAVNHPHIVRLLIEGGADIDLPDADGQTPLLRALTTESLESARVLLDAGADANLGDTNRVYPIFAALKFPALLERILESGVGVNVVSGQGFTPLFYAITIENPHVVECLLQAGADITAPGLEGASLIEHAVQVPDVFAVFVAHNADLNTRNGNGDTALHVAAANNDAHAAEALIAAGADIDAAGNAGDTPLHRAVQRNSTAVAEVLVAAGADVTRANDNGIASLDLVPQSSAEIQQAFAPRRDEPETQQENHP